MRLKLSIQNLVTLFFLTSYGSVGAVLFTPALPAIQSFFGVTVGSAQLTITAYLIGYSFGQLPYGPLANGLGRKKALYIGLSIATVGFFLSALSSYFFSFKLLIFSRFLQAIGSCVGLKIGFTMIGDLYEQKDATRKLSHLLIAFAVMPGVAIAIGGWITSILNWESCFYFLTIFGIILLFASVTLPETAHTIDRNALSLKEIFEAYKRKLTNKRIVLSALVMGCTTATVYLYASKAPFIGINYMGLSPETFGTLNLIPPIGMLGGYLLAPTFGSRFPLPQLMKYGIGATLLASLTMLIPFLFGVVTILTLFFSMLLIYLTQSIIFVNISAFGLSHAKNKSYASALLNFINIGIAVCALFLSEWIVPENPLLLPLFIFFCLLLLLFFWVRLKNVESEGL